MSTKSKRGLHKPTLQMALFLGGLLLFIPELCFSLDTADVVTKVNDVSTDITSILKANGIKILAITAAWSSVGLFALFHKPIGRAILGAFVVTAVTVFIHKWA